MNFKEWLLLTEKIMIKSQEFRDPLHALQHIQNTHPKPENIVITYTAIDKVGINPKSKYETPLGIYFYPLNYVVEKEMKVPFAGDKPYINVCEFANPNKILHMTSDVSNQKGLELLDVFPKEEVDKAIMKINPKKTLEKPLEEMIKKAQEHYDYKQNKLNNPQYDQEKENDIYKKYIDARNYYYNLKNELGVNYLGRNQKYYVYSNYSELWIATRILAYGKPILWNKNLRKCGIDGFVDHGTGTIHTNEKTQGVVFAANALKLLYSIPNITSVNDIKYRNKIQIHKMTDEQIIALVKSHRGSNFFDLINQLTDKDRVIKIIIQYKKELSDNDVTNLILTATNKDQIAELIINEKPELYSDNVYSLLAYSKNQKKVATVLGKNNINKLHVQHVYDLLRDAITRDHNEESNKNAINHLDQMAEILEKNNIIKLNKPEICALFRFAPDKNQIAIILGSKNIIKIIDDDSCFQGLDLYFVLSDQKEQIIKAIIQHTKELSGKNVEILLLYATDKDKIAELLQKDTDNISKLSYENVENLFSYAVMHAEDVVGDKKQMAQILNKYHQKKTPEIQELINKYL